MGPHTPIAGTGGSSPLLFLRSACLSVSYCATEWACCRKFCTRVCQAVCSSLLRTVPPLRQSSGLSGTAALTTAANRWTTVVTTSAFDFARIKYEFSGVRGWWTRWRSSKEYQAQQARVEQGKWAERQLQALQAPWAAQQALATQNQAACQAARATREAVEAKVARWQSLLDQPWTPAEQAEMKAKAQAPKQTKPNPQRQVPPQPLPPTAWTTIRIVDGHGREISPKPPTPTIPSQERDGPERGASR